MKKNSSIIILCVGLVVIFGIFWIKKTAVNAPIVSDDVVVVACQGIEIASPAANSQVTFPLTITGTVHPAGNSGPWTVFEANAGSVVVKDSTGAIKSTPKALPIYVDWMNSNPKPFSVTIPALTGTPATNALTLFFSDDDPSGENPHYCSIPVTL